MKMFSPIAIVKNRAALLFLILLAGGAASVRGQSALDGFDPNANGVVRVVVVQLDGKILPVLAAGVPALPQGGIFYTVNTTSDTVVVGACQNGLPNCSLRGAIQTANSHPGADGIGFDLPAFSIINLTGALPDLTDSVDIIGPGADELTVRRNTGGNYRMFNVTTAGTVSFSGLTISNGGVVSGNNGGGIVNSNFGLVLIINCTLSDNSSANMGGGLVNGDGTVNLTNCTLNGNSAANGGGIYNISGHVSLTNCTINSNTTSGNGGGIFNTGILTVTNCTMSGNSATNGGGILNGPGGGANIKSSIVASNTDITGGHDIFIFGGSVTSQGFNLIGDNSGADASFPAGNPNANNDIVGTSEAPINPGLDPNGLVNNGGPTRTIALLTGSPAIDKGTSNGLTGNLTTDQRSTGFPRTFDYPFVANAAGGNGTDIGAFELLTPFCVSRKMHGATAFEVNLPLTATAGVECRIGGVNNDHQVVVTFPSPVSLTSASVTTGVGSVSSFTISGAQVTVNLINVANAQTIILTLFDVNDGTTTGNVSVPMGLLLGDTTGNGTVSASDVGQTKSKSGQAVDASNFRTDVNVSGSITAADIGLVKSKAGTALPP